MQDAPLDDRHKVEEDVPQALLRGTRDAADCATEDTAAGAQEATAECCVAGAQDASKVYDKEQPAATEVLLTPLEPSADLDLQFPPTLYILLIHHQPSPTPCPPACHR